MGNPWVWREAPLLPVGFWGWGLGPVGAEVHVLTLPPRVSQESSTAPTPTIEDERHKVSNHSPPAELVGEEPLAGGELQDSKEACVCDEGDLLRPEPRQGLGTDWHWADLGQSIRQSLADLG